MADQQIVPEGVPPSPPYADAYVVRHVGEVVTVYLMRVPPIFTDADHQTVFGGPELHAPVVSSVTLATELALQLATSIQQLVGKKS
jgi:hypothetical protein